MIMEIVKAMSKQIHLAIGDITIYSEQIKSNMKKPCVFISLLNFEEDKIMANRYFQKLSFNVSYYPLENLCKNEEFFDIGTKIKDSLEQIKTMDNDTLLNGTNMSFTVKDGYLNVFVTYGYFVLKESEKAEKMGMLSIINKSS